MRFASLLPPIPPAAAAAPSFASLLSAACSLSLATARHRLWRCHAKCTPPSRYQCRSCSAAAARGCPFRPHAPSRRSAIPPFSAVHSPPIDPPHPPPLLSIPSLRARPPPAVWAAGGCVLWPRAPFVCAVDRASRVCVDCICLSAVRCALRSAHSLNHVWRRRY